MFWLACLAYLLITYAIGGMLLSLTPLRQGYTIKGIIFCFITSPLWVLGFAVCLMGILMILPIIYCHVEKQNQNGLPEEIPDIAQWPKQKFKPKFGIKNKCEVKDL